MARPDLAPTQNLSAVKAQLLHALESCATEADIVQVLYAALHSIFNYQVVLLQVLEREGWYHIVNLDSGVLQDVLRRDLNESVFGRFFDAGETSVWHPALPGNHPVATRGPGSSKTPRTVIWVPVRHHDRVIGAVAYQSARRREVSAEEVEFLEGIHRHLGVLISNAYLNDTTRDQAIRLSALNAIARALSSTLDESGIVAALYSTLTQFLPVGVLELVVTDDDDPDGLRVLRYSAETGPSAIRLAADVVELAAVRAILQDGRSSLQAGEGKGDHHSSASVPIKEGGRVRGVLSIFAEEAATYENSTVVFLEQVADEVSLAVRNAWSYAAIEAQRRRLEVVNAVGRRLASSLDRWSIMRTLREELARHLDFDGFILATIRETKDGPIAEGYNYASGLEQPAYAVALASAGPSREAYETRSPILIQKSPWAHSVEAKQPAAQSLVFNDGAAIFIAPEAKARGGRVATRSFVWVPVLHGERVSALLSLQSYREEAFSDWHVKLLQDVAAHVSLSLANAEYYAAAQAERRRLEALHVLELGVAGSSDERQIAEAVFNGARSYMDASNLVLAYIDTEGRLTGFGSEHGRPVDELEPKPLDSTTFFKRLLQTGTTIVEAVPEELRKPNLGWATHDSRMPWHVLWVPIFQGDRVVAALSAQRFDDQQFSEDDVRLLESAAPVVGIALRTVRLHRANELALAHSVRIQEVAALAGHDLSSVVTSVADQARNMLGATGLACWAFDDDGKVTAAAGNGDEQAMRVLSWSGRTNEQTWAQAPRSVITGDNRSTSWSLIPLWYGDRMVGAIGSVHAVAAPQDPGTAPLDFARHAAIAIENARLVAETRGRIHTLEAVAAFTELDITQPAGTRTEMALLIERALAGANGSLWLLDGTEMIRIRPGSDLNERLDIKDPAWFSQAVRGGAGGNLDRRLRTLLRGVPSVKAEVFAFPILVDGQLGGMITVEGAAATSTETRRLMSVLAGQATVVLARLRLVDALDRERQMMDAILRHSPVGIILEDAEGRVVYANPEVEDLYGVPAESMTGGRSEEIVAAAGAVTASDSAADLSLGYELQLNNPDRFVQVRRVSIPGSEGEPDRVLTLHEDITQERQVLEAKDLMLRAIGHEVRSPAAAMKTTLAGIVQWDQLMEPDQRRTLLHEAYEQSDRLLNLVENQLIIARLETGRFEPNPAPVPLSQTLEQVMQVLRHRYGDRAGVVDVKIREGLPPAFCEPIHLTQVLTNLIGNALEYTTVPIHVTARSREGWLEITVADEGPGLPSDRVDTLFQKAGPAGQNRARGGLGLGLYLCSLVVQHSFGGRIWLEKTGRAGTTFKFTVQAAQQPSRQAAVPVSG